MQTVALLTPMASSAPYGSLAWIARSPLPIASFTRACLALSFALHVTAAVFSVGFHHADEHFQILEFANAKLGRSATSELPWEYAAKNRSWFQPAIAVAAVRAMQTVGIEGPTAWTLGLRLLSAVLGWGAVVALCCGVFGWLRSPGAQRFTILALSTLWFTPYLHARYSSESWSGSLFFLGFLPLVLAVQRETRRLRPSIAFACGLALGLAFEARYQSSLLLSGALLWCLRYARLTRATWLNLGAGGAFAIALGLVLDRWGYGAWVLVPWHYLRVNLLEGVAAEQFGASPFWAYAWWVIVIGPGPLGVLFVLAMLTMWIAKPRFSLTWCTLPFVIGYSLIAHKEPRFLFPIFPAFPVIVAMAWQAVAARLVVTRRLRRLMTMGLLLCAAINLVFAAAVLVLPARKLVAAYSAIERLGVTELYWVDADPYQQLGPLRPNFYEPDTLEVVGVPSYADFERLLADADGPLWLFRSGLGLPPDAAALAHSCRLEWQSIPAWAERDPSLRVARWVDGLEGRTVFLTENWRFSPRALYRCEPER
jgi:phosphatidylinositol glycan class B